MKKKLIGKVYLIGAGPGDPRLLTLRGKEILENCDVVVYDYLAPSELLTLSRNARKIYVGKKGTTKSSRTQSAINRLLKRLAKQGKTVARLKGGDPFIFGRGGEEALFLQNKKIPFEVVPGVTAALGAAAYAGIPLTHREWASQVTFVTAHEDPAKKKSVIRWEALAHTRGTLVFYMGAKALPQAVKKLVENGLAKNTPVAVIQWATTPGQRVVEGTLANVVGKVKQASVSAPVVTIVGRVAALRKKLDWFSRAPLRGKTVLVTRARHQASLLKRELESLGAQVLEMPMIEILPPHSWEEMDSVIRKLDFYDWLIFTSANGVEKFMERVQAIGKDVRVFGKIKIGVIGPATASKLLEYHLRTDIVPREYISESLARALGKQERLEGKKILLVRADIAREFLKEELIKKGALVDEIVAYRTKPASGNGKGLMKKFERGDIDFVTFTSSSTVKNFVSKVGEKDLSRLKDKARWISIGPITSKTAKDFGLKIHRQARRYTIPGLVEAIAKG